MSLATQRRYLGSAVLVCTLAGITLFGYRLDSKARVGPRRGARCSRVELDHDDPAHDSGLHLPVTQWDRHEQLEVLSEGLPLGSPARQDSQSHQQPATVESVSVPAEALEPDGSVCLPSRSVPLLAFFASPGARAPPSSLHA